MAASPLRWNRWGLRVLAALAVVLLIAAALATFTVRQSFPQVNGEIAMPGLENEATVYRDANGIPRIYADTPGDLFQAQGFVHAQDRFWQMDPASTLPSGIPAPSTRAKLLFPVCESHVLVPLSFQSGKC